jgi:hypothetical protein
MIQTTPEATATPPKSDFLVSMCAVPKLARRALKDTLARASGFGSRGGLWLARRALARAAGFGSRGLLVSDHSKDARMET